MAAHYGFEIHGENWSLTPTPGFIKDSRHSSCWWCGIYIGIINTYHERRCALHPPPPPRKPKKEGLPHVQPERLAPV